MVQKTFNIFNIFNISAVSSTFLLTFLTFQQFGAFLEQKAPSSAVSVTFISKPLPNCRNTAISHCSEKGL